MNWKAFTVSLIRPANLSHASKWLRTSRILHNLPHFSNRGAPPVTTLGNEAKRGEDWAFQKCARINWEVAIVTSANKLRYQYELEVTDRDWFNSQRHTALSSPNLTGCFCMAAGVILRGHRLAWRGDDRLLITRREKNNELMLASSRHWLLCLCSNPCMHTTLQSSHGINR